jgi:hypothetical protein
LNEQVSITGGALSPFEQEPGPLLNPNIDRDIASNIR